MNLFKRPATHFGNSYDNAMAESLMKTLKVETVYPMAFETFGDVAEELPPLPREVQRPARAVGARIPQPAQFEEENARSPVKTAA